MVVSMLQGVSTMHSFVDGLFNFLASWVRRKDGLDSLINKMDAPTYDVFLGGSCGGTTWRADVVAPRLAAAGVTYYNPVIGCPSLPFHRLRRSLQQRATWSPELIDQEQTAKQNADTLLFVVDPETVSATSVVEIAYSAASSRSVVVVFPHRVEWVANAEHRDAPDRARVCGLLSAVVKRHRCVRLFDSVESATDFIIRRFVARRTCSSALRDKRCRWIYLQLLAEGCLSRCQDVTRSLARPSTLVDCGKALVSKRRQLTPKSWRERLPMSATLLPEMCTLLVVCVVGPRLWTLATAPIVLAVQLAFFSFVLPRSVVSASQLQARSLRLRLSLLGIDRPQTTTPTTATTTTSSRSRRSRRPLRASVSYGVNLGASGSAQHAAWLRQIAAPQLERKRISYLDNSCLKSFDEKLAAVAVCSYVFFVVKAESFLSGLVELAYYIGRVDVKTVACAPLTAFATNNNDSLTADCKKAHRNECYERALAYLRDMAQRRGTMLFDDLQDSLRALMRRVSDDEFDARTAEL